MGHLRARRGSFRSLIVTGLSTVALSIAALASPAYGQTTDGSAVQITVDAPAAGETVKAGDQITFGGWAADTSGTGGVIETVEVFIDGMPGEGGVSLGKAEYGKARPDVGVVLGNPALTNVGFDLNWKVSGAGGSRMAYVFVYSTTSGWSYETLTLNVDGSTASNSATSESASTSYQGYQNPYESTGYRGQGAVSANPIFNPAAVQPYGSVAGGNPYGTNPYGAAANATFANGYPAQVNGPYGAPYGYNNAAGYSNSSGYGLAAGNPYSVGNPYAAAYPYANGSPYGYASTYGSGYGYPSAYPYQSGYGSAYPYAPSSPYSAGPVSPGSYPYGAGYPYYPGYPNFGY
jgi:hypothetical protein